MTKRERVAKKGARHQQSTETRPSVRKVSLVQEIQEAENVLFAVGFLLEEMEESAEMSAGFRIYGQGAVRALVGQLGVRLRLLEEAIRGETNPGLLWTPRNAAPPEAVRGDLVLTAW